MCGICGVINYRSSEFVDEKIIKKMNNALLHRGPDEEGYFIDKNIALGIHRLSIIDLEKGTQPIYNESQTIVCIQDGQIYNYKELREELETRVHKFYTNSSTEVIVHLYEEYNEEFVRYLRGMFAICIYDKNKDKVLLARDRLGIKPLYYALIDNNLVFASELKAILKYTNIDKEIDLQALDNYFTLLYIPSPLSIFKRIKKLPPATILIYQDGDIRLIKYWEINLRKDLRKEENEYQEELEQLLKDTVRQHLIADVEVGCFLSGGMDSSTITALATEFSPSIKTFSVSFDETPQFDEIKYARIVAKKFATTHYEFNVNMKSIEILPKLINHFDEPFADPSLIPTYLISEVARKYVKVVLAGDGGDELFCGYEWLTRQKFIEYYNKLSPRFIRNKLTPQLDENLIKRKGILASIRRFLYDASVPPLQGYLRRTTCFNEEMKNNLYSDYLKEELVNNNSIRDTYLNEVINEDIYHQIMYTDLKLYLPEDGLTKVDRMSMAHSLEVRAPLLDYKLVEFALSLPVELKLRGLKSKYLLKKVMQKKLPNQILKQHKQGFTPPIDEWLKGKGINLIKDTLLAIDKQYFNPTYISWLIEQQEKNKQDFSYQLFSLLIFTLWKEKYLK